MKELAKRFWKEEEGLGTVELVILIGVLVGIAVIFRGYIQNFVRGLIGRNFQNIDGTAGSGASSAAGASDAASAGEGLEAGEYFEPADFGGTESASASG